MKPKYQKPHRWRPRKDASHCIACTQPFARGEMVFSDVAVNVHQGCLALYRTQLIELGILKSQKEQP